MKATVYKSTGSWYVVKNEQGKQFNARMLGKFKIDGLTSTNPIAVGDQFTTVKIILPVPRRPINTSTTLYLLI
jgi:hypothetical protein